MRFRNPAGHAGLLNNLVALTNALAGFFETRVALFAQESKTALIHLLLLAAAAVAAMVLVMSGYVFLIVSVIFGIAHAAGISWIWIALGAAVLHFLLAAACGFFVKMRLTHPIFSASIAELKRDREWLKTLNKSKQSES